MVADRRRSEGSHPLPTPHPHPQAALAHYCFSLPPALEGPGCFSDPGCLQADWQALRGKVLCFPKCWSYPITPMALNNSEMLKQQTGCPWGRVWQTADPKLKRERRGEREKTNPVTGEKKTISLPRNAHEKDCTPPSGKYWCCGTLEVIGPEESATHFYLCLEPR